MKEQVLISVDSVKTNRNLRCPEESLRLLMDSIVTVGLRHGIIVDQDYNLVSGRSRLEAFKRLGRSEIPANIIKDFAECREAIEYECLEYDFLNSFTKNELLELQMFYKT